MISRESKPRLAANEVVEITNPAAIAAGLDDAFHTVELPPTLLERLRGGLRGLVGLVIGLAGLVTLIYLVLAATVLIVAKPFDLNAVVLRGVYAEGQVPEGAIMLATSGRASTKSVDKLVEGTVGVDAASVVTIIAGPAAEVHNDTTGQIIADGKPTGYYAPVDARTLTRQYVGLCVKGACKTATTVLVGQDAMIGEVKGYITTLGPLTKPTTPASALHATTTPPQ